MDDLTRRYPWSQYAKDRRPQFMTKAQDLAWVKENCPFTVRWTVPDSDRLMYGWRCESRSFKTEAEALAAAEANMGVAFDVEALRWNWDVPHGNPDRAVSIYRRKNAAAAKRRARR